MSGMTTDAEPQLRRDSLGLSELVFHAVTHIAPATSVVFIFPAIAHQAGPAMPLSFVLTTIVCMFVGSTVFQFSSMCRQAVVTTHSPRADWGAAVDSWRPGATSFMRSSAPPRP